METKKVAERQKTFPHFLIQHSISFFTFELIKVLTFNCENQKVEKRAGGEWWWCESKKKKSE